MPETPHTPSGPWFNAVARFLGPAYLRNAFPYRRRAERSQGKLFGLRDSRSNKICPVREGRL